MKRLPVGEMRDWFYAPGGNEQGVSGFRSWRFWLVLALYLIGFLLLVRDPFFWRGGVFIWQQGMVSMLLAFVITASLCWEMMLFGPPRGANLLLQFAMCLPVFLFIARITASPSTPPADVGLVTVALGGVFQLLQLDRLLSFIPFWIRDLFANWQVTLFFMVTMGALSFRKLGVRLSLLLVLTAGGLFSVFASASPSGFLLGGLLCLFTGMALQFNRWDRTIYYENVVARLAAAPCDEAALRSILRIAVQGKEDERVSEDGVRRIVKSEYAALGSFSPAELRGMAAEVTGRILGEYRIMRLTGGGDGLFLVPEERLCRCETLLGGLAVWPRVCFTLAVAAVWVMLPVDLIPDSIPFLGALDDAAVTILSGIVLKNSISDKR